jgi:hypothetical protein
MELMEKWSEVGKTDLINVLWWKGGIKVKKYNYLLKQ